MTGTAQRFVCSSRRYIAPQNAYEARRAVPLTSPANRYADAAETRARQAARTLAITRWPQRPAAVRIDSGWNWTAQRPAASSSIAITTPSGVTAVTVNPPATAGSVAYNE